MGRSDRLDLRDVLEFVPSGLRTVLQ